MTIHLSELNDNCGESQIEKFRIVHPAKVVRAELSISPLDGDECFEGVWQGSEKGKLSEAVRKLKKGDAVSSFMVMMEDKASLPATLRVSLRGAA